MAAIFGPLLISDADADIIRGQQASVIRRLGKLIPKHIEAEWFAAPPTLPPLYDTVTIMVSWESWIDGKRRGQTFAWAYTTVPDWRMFQDSLIEYTDKL